MPSEDPIGAALQRAGAQVEQSSLHVLNEMASQKHNAEYLQRAVDEKLKNAERHVEASIHENYLKEWSAKKADELRTRTDYQNFDTLADQDTKEFQSYLDKIEDPDVKRAVTAGAQPILHEHMNVIRTKKAAVLSDVGAATLDKSLGMDLQEWVQSDGERETIKARMTAKIAANADAGIIKAVVAENLIQNLDAKFEETYAAELMNTDPLRLKKELDGGGLTHIDPVKRQQLIAQTAGKAVKQTVTRLLIDLKSQYPDIQERIKKIESVDYLKSLGDEGAEIQNTLLSYTLREWKTQEEAYKVIADDKIGKASVKIYNGQGVTDADTAGLRPPELALVEKIADYQIRQDRAELREKRVEARQERIEEREKRYDEKVAKQEKSDGIEGELIDRIIRNEPIDITKDIYARLPDGLSHPAKTRLIGMLNEQQRDPSYKLGADVINKAFPPNQAGEKGRAMIDFIAQVKQEKAVGKRIIEIAEQIATPKKKGLMRELLDSVFGGKPKKGVPSQEDLEYTAQKHGITVDEVKRRMGTK